MKKNIKRSRKKLTNSKTEDESSVSGEAKDGNDVIGEQTRLCKHLEDYTCEFERRLEQLNFRPNEKDLVILYIMNLHPRWKRLVEPLELTFSSWKEAAHLARHHCAKASAILGAKRQDSLDILRSPESMALLSAGYFVPESHPFVQRYPGVEAVKHLIQGYNDNDSSVSSPSSSTTSPVPSSPTCSTLSSPLPPPPPTPFQPAASINNNSSQNQQDPPPQTPSSSKSSINTSKVKPESSTAITTNTTTTKPKSPVKSSPTVPLPPQKEPTAVVNENAAKNTDTNTTMNITTDKTLENSSEKISDKLSAENPNDGKTLEKPVMNNTNNNNNDHSEKPSLEKTTTTTTTPRCTKSSPKSPNAKTIKTASTGKNKTNKNSICYRIPKEHSGVNLGFLELKVKDKSVKALLSKIHWYVSAISLDCVKRLGLEIIAKKNEFIKTSVFSLEEPMVGHVQFPINDKNNILLYVLPMIYNGKVDLVLGSDFFDIFNSTLNIKARAIHFMDKESPYSVSHL